MVFSSRDILVYHPSHHRPPPPPLAGPERLTARCRRVVAAGGGGGADVRGGLRRARGQHRRPDRQDVQVTRARPASSVRRHHAAGARGVARAVGALCGAARAGPQRGSVEFKLPKPAL